MRLAHPLYGEVRLTRAGVLHIARALLAAGNPDDELRCAILLLGSDLAPEAGMLLRAATRSAELLDLPLAVRLARAAIAAGGGFAAQGILVEALSLLGQGSRPRRS